MRLALAAVATSAPPGLLAFTQVTASTASTTAKIIITTTSTEALQITPTTRRGTRTRNTRSRSEPPPSRPWAAAPVVSLLILFAFSKRKTTKRSLPEPRPPSRPRRRRKIGVSTIEEAAMAAKASMRRRGRETQLEFLQGRGVWTMAKCQIPMAMKFIRRTIMQVPPPLQSQKPPRSSPNRNRSNSRLVPLSRPFSNIRINRRNNNSLSINNSCNSKTTSLSRKNHSSKPCWK
mmetsp:Transcript_686/g.1435  ORF Transcript_686/g.1435 Transcript_686/m.1435 type:complete len:233 (+) Transcript_686:679-1377(+)